MVASRWLVRAFCTLALLLFWGDAALADPPKKLALVIANGDYEGGDWPALRNPSADARLIRDSLIGAGFEVVQPAVNLRRAQLLQRLDEFRTSVAALPPHSIALIYYSGHGIQVDGTNYIVPLDGQSASRIFSSGGSARERMLTEAFVSLNHLLNVFGSKRRDMPSAANILILDACRVNPLEGTTRAVGLPKGLADVSQVDNTLIAFAAAPGTYAYDGDGVNSPYALALSSELKKRALPLQLLFNGVRAKTVELTAGRQRPTYSDALSGIFCLDDCGSGHLQYAAASNSVPPPAATKGYGSSSTSSAGCAFCPELVSIKLGGAAALSVSRFPVSGVEWRKCVEDAMCSTGLDNKNPDEPAVGMTWNDADQYVRWLSQRTGKRWRLLTEEEWRRLHQPFANSPRRKVTSLPSFKTATEPPSGLAYVGRLVEWTSSCRLDCRERVAMGTTYEDDFTPLLEAQGIAPELAGKALGFRVVQE